MPIQKITTGVVDASVFSSPTITSPTISGNTNFDSNTLFVDATNNRVGLGTANPSRPLDVLGSARLSFSGGDNYVEFESASNYVGRNGSTADIWLNAINGQKTILGVNNVAVAQCSGTNFQFNSGYGSVATAYGCRAWVNFDGTGTVSIRASGNVSSITDNGTGDYTINFTTAFPDANYAASGILSWQSGVSASGAVSIRTDAGTPTTTTLRINCVGQNGTDYDRVLVAVSVFR